MSETHYSLKEMETITVHDKIQKLRFLSETHYSLKEMETLMHELGIETVLEVVGNPLLSERDGNIPVVSSYLIFS